MNVAFSREHAPGNKMSSCQQVHFTAGGSNCASDKVPKKRAKDYITAASRLFSDPASMMHGMVLASAQKPLASLLDDASSAQQHKGWEYGYLDGFANETRGLNRLTWQVRRPRLFPANLLSQKARVWKRRHS